jgi:pilus assembly protein CpaE
VPDLLKVALIDQSPDARATLPHQLQGAGFDLVGSTGYGAQVAEMVTETRPDFILLGLEEPVARGLQMLHVLADTAPQAPIIVYSSRTDGAFVRRVLLAGARDCLELPLTPEQVTASAQAIQAQEATRRRRRSGELSNRAGCGTVLTIFGLKGGIGKTTVAANLAIALHRQTSASAVLVDMDMRFGDIAVLLGLLPEKTLADAARDAQRLDRSAIRRYLLHHPAGISVLAAPHKPAEWDQVEPEQLRSIVQVLAQTFDYVILDTPGTFNKVVDLSLELATVVLLVTSLERTSVKDADQALAKLRASAFPEEKLKLLVNHATPAHGLEARDVAQTLGAELFWQIPFDLAVLRAGQLGLPVVLASPQSPVSQSLVEFAGLIGGMR